MNLTILKVELDKLKAPRSIYAISKLIDGKTCIVESDGLWKVVLVERGEERELFSSQSESDACEYMLKRMEQYIKLLM